MNFVITFPSTYQAINFEDTFKNTALNFLLMPVPREISSSCGIAAKIRDTDVEGFKKTVQQAQENNIEIEGTYSIEEGKKKNKITEIT